jgi:tripartite motif-containing protein 2/3
MLKELDNLHSAGELAIMDMYHGIEKAIDQMDTACRFTDRVLAHGNGVEILSMKKHITGQLLNLMNSMPRLEPAMTILFESDANAFAVSVAETFGHFVKSGQKASLK